MSRRILAALLAISLPVAGCGDGREPATMVAPKGSTTGPHGGVAVPLPDDRGYVELLVERGRPGRGGGKPAAGKVAPKLAAYFLGPDLKAPLSTLPSDVSVKTVAPTGTSSDAMLRPEPPAGGNDPGRFLSPEGDYDYDELSGELTATLDGQTITVPFAFR